MEQLRPFADDRQTAGCAHCGGEIETRDHVPARVLLDEPFPPNLPVVGSCRRCNEGSSADEEYVACLVECALVGSALPEKMEREKIRRLLTEKPALAGRLASAWQQSGQAGHFDVEARRVASVVVKLARGHAFFELHEPQYDQPSGVAFEPLPLMSQYVRNRFGQPVPATIWPEVGSRAMQRLIGIGDFESGWVVVQPRRYRYLAAVGQNVVVRIVLSEYLACEVTW